MMQRCPSTLTRRTFLATAAALAAVSHEGTAANLSSKDAATSLRIGLIGVGKRGRELLEARQPLDGVRVTALCDVSKEHKAWAHDQYGSDPCSNWRELVARADLDGVVIATPDHCHGPMTIAALERGKHVYCEPPTAMSVAEAKAVHDAAIADKAILYTGGAALLTAPWRAVAAAINGDGLGAIQRVQVSGVPVETDLPHGYANHHGHWSRYWNYGNGPALAAFWHHLAAISMLCQVGPPQLVSAAGGIWNNDGRETPDALVMTAQYSHGVTVVLATGPARGTPTATIQGSKGIAECKLPPTHEPVNIRESLSRWLVAIHRRDSSQAQANAAYSATAATALARQAYRDKR